MASLVSRPRHSIQMYWARRSYQRLGSPSRRLKVARLGGGRSAGSSAAAASSLWKGIRLALRAAALLATPALLLARLRDAYVDAMVALGGSGVRRCAALARSRSGAEAGLWDKRVPRALRELLARLQIGHPEAKSRAMDGLLDALRRDERSVLAALGRANVAAMVQLLTASAPVVREKASTVRAPGSGAGAPVACLGSARRRGSPELPAAAQAAAPRSSSPTMTRTTPSSTNARRTSGTAERFLSAPAAAVWETESPVWQISTSAPALPCSTTARTGAAA